MGLRMTLEDPPSVVIFSLVLVPVSPKFLPLLLFPHHLILLVLYMGSPQTLIAMVLEMIFFSPSLVTGEVLIFAKKLLLFLLLPLKVLLPTQLAPIFLVQSPSVLVILVVVLSSLLDSLSLPSWLLFGNDLAIIQF